jgi:tripartite-type tricarboxylate transporter receptor subunit TctC
MSVKPGFAKFTICALSCLFAYPCAADEVSDFYRGKSIDLGIGFGAGGGYDSYARLFARHAGAHIPGSPAIIPRNMPGGGGLIIANHLYNVAPRNGQALAMFGGFNAVEALLGNANAKFDPVNFTWIGNMNIEVEGCGVWRSSGISTVSDLVAKSVSFGSSGQASTTSRSTLTLNHLLGAQVKLVYGYQGSKDINLAMQRGEVDGACGISVSSAVSEWASDLKSGNLRIIIQLGEQKTPLFGDAPSVFDYLKDESDRRLAAFVFRPNEVGRPIVAPPGLPAARTLALRAAFATTMEDPVFLEDAGKLRLPIKSQTGEAIVQLFTQLSVEAPLVLNRVRKITSIQ